MLHWRPSTATGRDQRALMACSGGGNSSWEIAEGGREELKTGGRDGGGKGIRGKRLDMPPTYQEKSTRSRVLQTRRQNASVAGTPVKISEHQWCRNSILRVQEAWKFASLHSNHEFYSEQHKNTMVCNSVTWTRSRNILDSSNAIPLANLTIKCHGNYVPESSKHVKICK